MSEVISALEECQFKEQFVLFDTNVWIYIYGNDPRPEKAIYSDFYASVLKAGNHVIVNEQIISEFFNRVCKMEFESLYGRNNLKNFKKWRKTKTKFKAKVEVIKEICLEILSDCRYQQTNLEQDCLTKNLNEVVDGQLDLTDAALVNECSAGDFILVSNDGDFAGANIRFATANEKVLAKSD